MMLPVNSGVPQGSILGPLLYTVFVNELPQVLQRSNASELRSDQRIDKICCYADDSTLSSSDSDHSELTKKLTNDYKIVSEFMIKNRLSVCSFRPIFNKNLDFILFCANNNNNIISKRP